MKRRTAIVLVSLIAFVAAGAGYLLGSARSGSGGRSNVPGASGGLADAPSTAKQVYTCSMHPQVRLPGPGKCPICGMDLVPIAAAAPPTPGADGGGPAVPGLAPVTLSADRMKASGIRTTRASV